jgi:hypothetical protein
VAKEISFSLFFLRLDLDQTRWKFSQFVNPCPKIVQKSLSLLKMLKNLLWSVWSEDLDLAIVSFQDMFENFQD